RVDPARLDALVAEDALRVVTDVELVVHLDGLVDRLGRPAVRLVVVTGVARVALARRGWLARGSVPLGVGAVVGLPALDVGTGESDVDAGAQELEHHLAREPDAFGIGLDLHPRLGL